MAKSTAVSSALTQRYARALIELAQENKVLPKVEADVLALQNVLESSSDFSFFIKADSISAARQQAVFADLAKQAKFQTLTLNFLNVLSANGRVSALPEMLVAVRKLLAELRNEMSATVETANVLTAAQQKELKDALSQATGSTIVLDAQVNEDLLGGMVLTVGSRRIDDSVAGRLERLKTAMSARASNLNTTVETLSNKKEA